MRSNKWWYFLWPWVTFEGHFSDLHTVVTLCAMVTCDLLAIAKFLVFHHNSSSPLRIFAARYYASVVSVHLSVRPSVTFVDSVVIFKFFPPSDSHTILVFRTKRHGNIPSETPLTGASNAGGVCTSCDSEPISGFIACCDRLSVINTAPPDRGKLWHLSLVVSGVACWRR